MPKTKYTFDESFARPRFSDSGDTLSEFFDVSDKAREGGMGDVFFCRDKRDNKFYVLKTFNEGTSPEQFEKEALFALCLPKHPYVVYSYTVVSDENKYYLVMEFVGKQPYSIDEKVVGSTLHNVTNGLLEEKQALIWAIQICRGMDFLNSCGLKAHKDLKPENILISPSNDIKIADFGLSVLDKKGGTKGYQAPECTQEKKEADVRSDIYSFGVMLYQMLNKGDFPFVLYAGEWQVGQINEHRVESSLCAEILKKCLARKPEDRYNSFSELEDAICAYVNTKFPEYILPEKQIQGTSKMFMRGIEDPLFAPIVSSANKDLSAQEFLAKGVGCYVLTNYALGFVFLSEAIKKNPKLKTACKYRYKCAMGNGFLLTGQDVAVCRFAYYLFILALISASILLVNSAVYYLTRGQVGVLHEFLLDSICALILMCDMFSYWDYEKKHKPWMWLCAYLVVPLYFLWRFIGDPVPVIFDSVKIRNMLLWDFSPLLLIVFIIPSSLLGIQTKSRFIVSFLFGLLGEMLRNLDTRIRNHDADKMYDTPYEKYWHILNDKDNFSDKEYKEACEKLYKDPKNYPYDKILYCVIEQDIDEENEEAMEKHYKELEEKFGYANNYVFYALDVIVSHYDIRDELKAKEIWKKILELYRQRADFPYRNISFIRSVKYDYPYFGKSVLDLVLIAFYHTRSYAANYYFQLASAYFSAHDAPRAAIFYCKFLESNPNIDFEAVNQTTKDSLEEFEREVLCGRKDLLKKEEKLKIWDAKSIYLRIGYCAYELKGYKTAYQSFCKAIESDPANKDLYIWRRKAARWKLFYKGCLKDTYLYILDILQHNPYIREKEKRLRIYFNDFSDDLF